jgi:porin
MKKKYRVTAFNRSVQMMSGLIAGFCSVASPLTAHAQDELEIAAASHLGDERRPYELAQANPSAIGGVVAPAPDAPSPTSVVATPGANPYARYRDFLPKGWNLTMPDPSNYIDQDPYQYRTEMAEHGLFFYGFSNNTYTYDLRNGNRLYDGKQVYSGQESTYTSTNSAYLTYDASRVGLAGGQLTLGVMYSYATWQPGGPTHWHVADFRYYQAFLDKKVELTFGYLGNSFVYNGIYVGGNLAGGTYGVSASIPQQVGMSISTFTRPGANVKVHFGDFYSLSGIQRSWNPGGLIAEVRENNGLGLGWSGDSTGELLLQEFGYQRAAAPGKPQTWIRTGYGYNNSHYASLKNPGTTDKNHYWSFLADRQIWQMSPGAATRGLYAGFTVMQAPDEFNRFAEYYEGRLYLRAPFAGRPTDSASLIVNQNRFSKDARAVADAAGQLTDKQATTVAMSYTANVYHGIFVTSGFSYIDHPRAISTIAEQRGALNYILNALVYF